MSKQRRVEPYENNTASFFIRHLRNDIKDKFKAGCAARGKTMVQVIEEMMLEKIQQWEGIDAPFQKVRK